MGGSITPLDGVILAVLLVAVLRGLFIGLIRESFSIAALGGACISVRVLTAPASERLLGLTGDAIPEAAAPWIAGGLVAVGTVLAVAGVGRWIRKGARAVGLGWADRLGGLALGAAEGALLGTLIVLGTTTVIGRDHPVIADSRSLEAFDDMRALVRAPPGELPQVAAPPS